MSISQLSGLFCIGLLLAGGNELRASELPTEAAKIFSKLEQTERELQQNAEAALARHKKKAIGKLQALQDSYCRQAQLDQALAIRDLIRQIKGIRPDPGILSLKPDEIGKVYLFKVKGSISGNVWGTEVYTSDSHLAAAAVHMGVLKVGQEGLVKVRVLAGQKSYQGSSHHGVNSQAYGPWQVSFTVQAGA